METDSRHVARLASSRQSTSKPSRTRSAPSATENGTRDVGLEEDVKALIAAAEDKYGPVDVFFSNAGLSRKGQETASDADWDVSWRVHVMSHVFAARALVPGMLARGSGYLLNTASAAGLLASLNSMPYGVTKNAAVALAEHLAIQYGDRGIRVSVLCPQSVQTGMTTPGPSAARVDGVLQPGEVARMVIEAMAEERFLISRIPRCRNTCSARPPIASAGCPAKDPRANVEACLDLPLEEGVKRAILDGNSRKLFA